MRVQPGDSSVPWLALPPQTDRKKVVIIEGGTPRTVGMTTEEIVLIEADGRPALRRIQVLKSDELGRRRSETTVFRENFLPHTHLDVTEEYTLTLLYRGTRITGKKQRAGGRVIPIRTEVGSPVFDAHSVEMVLRVLPLADGYVAELPVFHASQGQQMLVTVHVFGREPMTSSGDRVKVWKVRTDWGSVTQYYWIGVESGELLRQDSELSEGVQLAFIR